MMIYDTDGKVETGPFEGDLVTAYGVPTDGTVNAEAKDFRLTARESRFFIKTLSETPYGLFESHVQGDWFGEGGTTTWSNSRTFRLREAYGKLSNGKHVILAGQTWSTFMDLAAAPPIMDFSCDPGITFVRQGMVRYQYNIDKGHYVAIAIENPDRGLLSAGPVSFLSRPGNSEEKLPDLIIKHFYAQKWGHISAKGLLRQFDLDGDSVFGWGLSLSGSLNVGNGHKIYFSGLYGDGIGRYAGLETPAGAGVTADGDAETAGFWSLNGGVTLALRTDLNLTIGAGYSEYDKDSYAGSDAIFTGLSNKNAFSWHTMLAWKMTKNIEIAGGVMGFEKELIDGREGDLTRFQSYVKYSF
ncbi:MAG: porin [Deltaproteobacteria bacterium]|nr:porin [Deltaproteobacteria bacterium]